MDQTLTLSDGTLLTNSYIVPDGNNIWLHMYTEMTIGEVFALLNAPERTRTITAKRFGDVIEYTGFTELFYVRKDKGGYMSAALRKDA